MAEEEKRIVPSGALMTPTVESDYLEPDSPDPLSPCMGTTGGLSRFTEATCCATDKTYTSEAMTVHGTIEISLVLR